MKMCAGGINNRINVEAGDVTLSDGKHRLFLRIGGRLGEWRKFPGGATIFRKRIPDNKTAGFVAS